MPVRYADVSFSWNPNSAKLKTLSTITCASFFFPSMAVITSFFKASAFDGGEVFFFCENVVSAKRKRIEVVNRILVCIAVALVEGCIEYKQLGGNMFHDRVGGLSG